MNNTRKHQVRHRLKELEKKKEPWLTNYEIVSKYLLARKHDFRAKSTPGAFLSTDVPTAAPALALQVSVSTMLGALWPSASKSVRIEPSSLLSKEIQDSEEVQEFFKKKTNKLTAVMSDHRLRLVTQLDENQNDLLAFGTGAIGVFADRRPDARQRVRYESIDIKNMLIDEDATGTVNTVYIKTEYSIYQVQTMYPIELFSAKTQTYIREGKYDQMVTILKVIEERPPHERKGTEGNKSFPFRMEVYELVGAPTGTASNTINESDVLLEESGFETFPVMVSRFWKGRNEVYGRGPGSVAIPTILELCRLVEYFADGSGKKARPPLMAQTDAIYGSGEIDLSIGGVTRTHSGARMQDGGNRPALEPIFVVGELNSLKERIQELEDEITRVFFIDRLLDFNNSTRMTAKETGIRDNLRGMSLNSVFARQISELYMPMVERTYDILYAAGELGLLPDDPRVEQQRALGLDPIVIPEQLIPIMAAGIDFYELEFITPAMRLQRQEEIQGIRNFAELLAAIASINPEVLDGTDLDELIAAMAGLEGVPPDIIKSLEEVQEIRKSRAEQQSQMAQAQAQQQQAEGFRAGAQGAQAAAIAANQAKEAGVDLGGLLGGQ